LSDSKKLYSILVVLINYSNTNVTNSGHCYPSIHRLQQNVDQGFRTWGVGTPCRCQTQIQGVSNSFPGSNIKIRNLVPRNICGTFEFWSTTMGVSTIN